MKKSIVLLISFALILGMSVVSSHAVTIDYGDVTLSNWQTGNFGQVWNVDLCDVTLSYTINMSGIATPGWVFTEVGIREVGAPNLDPNLKGGFLLSKYAYPCVNDNLAEAVDYHVLMKHGWLYEVYDADGPESLISPIAPWTYINYAFWFDRNGVNEWQETYWNYKGGITYNTGGVYDVEITYHAIDATNATMFATINGEQQGFYQEGYSSASPPSLMPVGRTFPGDRTNMQVFYGRNAGGGNVTLSDITVTGCLKTISVAGCDTGVDDRMIDDYLLSDLITQCDIDNLKNHGMFINCVAQLLNNLISDGYLTEDEKDAIMACVGASDIGKKIVIEIE